MYGGTKAFDERQFRAVVDGKVVNGVADDVAIIGGKKTAVEAKFVDGWGSSLRNPASPSGSRPWSVAEQTKMVDQAKKYSSPPYLIPARPPARNTGKGDRFIFYLIG